jgi:hypothetical protein
MFTITSLPPLFLLISAVNVLMNPNAKLDDYTVFILTYSKFFSNYISFIKNSYDKYVVLK